MKAKLVVIGGDAKANANASQYEIVIGTSARGLGDNTTVVDAVPMQAGSGIWSAVQFPLASLSGDCASQIFLSGVLY